MLYGTYPFSIRGKQSFIKDIRTRKVPNFEVSGVYVSSSLKELLTKMLNYDPKGRIKFVELYDHPLIKEKIGPRVEINPQMLKRDFKLNK
jgi:serine/threonine protein kinase